MRKKIFFTILFLFAFVGFAFAKEAKNALLIANGSYGRDFGALKQPVPEAIDLKAALESVGFSVTLIKDVDLNGMRKALKAFKSKVKMQGGIAFFHYGGHAVQVNGINYLIPLGAELEDEQDAAYNCLNIDDLMDSMQGDSNVIVLDSCRNNPFSNASHRGGATRGLAAVKHKPTNSIIVYSAEAGSTAQDGVFTPTLTKYITEKNIAFSDILITVRQEVHIKTGGLQEPGEYRKLTKPIYIAGIDNTAPTPSPSASDLALARPQAKPPAPQGNGQVGKDRTYNVKGVSFTMKHIDSVQDAVLGDDNQSDNKEHKVSLSSYYIGETEVTQELWQAVMGSNPSYYFKDSLKNPVEEVTWLDCIGFCNELTVAVMGDDDGCVYDVRGGKVVADFSKKGFRLPTEAEWEYAAMGGKGQRYAGCNIESQLKAYAWYEDNSDSKTHEVGTKKANKYGLYDMSGNVWEWCWDWYSSTPSGGKDPVGAVSGVWRVFRGGSWNYEASGCERGFRNSFIPSDSRADLGLRLACRP